MSTTQLLATVGGSVAGTVLAHVALRFTRGLFAAKREMRELHLVLAPYTLARRPSLPIESRTEFRTEFRTGEEEPA